MVEKGVMVVEIRVMAQLRLGYSPTHRDHRRERESLLVANKKDEI